MHTTKRVKKKFWFSLMVSGLCLLLCGNTCTRLPPVVLVDVPAELAAEWETLIREFPLPEEFRYLPAVTTQPAAQAAIRLFCEDWQSRAQPPAGNSLRKILRQTWYAPSVPLWDMRTDARREDLGRGVGILPLDAITLPDKALACDGLYPADNGYPLVSGLILALESAGNKPLPDTLRQWAGQLRENTGRPDILWLGGVGDVMPGEGAEPLLLNQGPGVVFSDTLPVLQAADLLLGNLEAAATEHDHKTPKSFNYKFQPPVLAVLKQAGFDYFSLANNHCYDYGEDGFRDTLHYLLHHGIATSGAGLSAAAAQAPWQTTVRGHHITVLSAGAYPVERNGFDGRRQAAVNAGRAGILWADAAGLTAIRQAFDHTGFKILLVHGGRERSLLPLPEQRDLYRHFIDLGADLVLGSHPHALQGMEAYRGKLIVYSLGNFLFPDEVIYPYATETVILLVGVYNRKILYVKPYSVTMQGTTVKRDPEDKGLTRIMQLTEGLNDDTFSFPGIN